jgi:hypothetical protein
MQIGSLEHCPPIRIHLTEHVEENRFEDYYQCFKNQTFIDKYLSSKKSVFRYQRNLPKSLAPLRSRSNLKKQLDIPKIKTNNAYTTTHSQESKKENYKYSSTPRSQITQQYSSKN